MVAGQQSVLPSPDPPKDRRRPRYQRSISEANAEDPHRANQLIVLSCLAHEAYREEQRHTSEYRYPGAVGVSGRSAQTPTRPLTLPPSAARQPTARTRRRPMTRPGTPAPAPTARSPRRTRTRARPATLPQPILLGRHLIGIKCRPFVLVGQPPLIQRVAS